MSVLESIRKRSALLIILVAVAMIAFLMGDLFKPSAGGNTDLTIAEIDDEKISYPEFNRKVLEYSEMSKRNGQNNPDQTALVEAVWQGYINEKIIDMETQKAGIVVSSKDAISLLASQSFIQNNDYFKGENGQFDAGKLQQYIQTLRENAQNSTQEAAAWQQWQSTQQAYQNSSLAATYKNLILYGIQKTDLEKKIENEKKIERIDANFLVLAYKDIEDPKINEQEITEYIETHSKEFERESSRDITYVPLEVVPSSEDENKALSQIKELLLQRVVLNKITSSYDTLPGFKNAKESVIFVNENSDTPFDSKYYQKNALLEKEGQQITNFAFNADKGDLIGPLKVGNRQYKLIKLLEKKRLPDSVQASHIFIGYTNNPTTASEGNRTQKEANALSDSLYSVLKKNPKKFEDLVKKFSDDTQTKESKGVLPWATYGELNHGINKFIFFGKKNTFKKLKSTAGFHIVRIDEQKNIAPSVKLAIITRDIVPSELTEDEVYTQARQLMASAKLSFEEFEAKAKSYRLPVRFVEEIKINESNIQGIGSRRDMVKWAFDPKTTFGSLKLFNTENGYVVAMVSRLSEKGLASVAEDEVKKSVSEILSKQKKERIIKERIIQSNTSNNLESLSKSLSVKIQNVLSLGIQNPVLPGAGKEPLVVASFMNQSVNTLSKPIAGNYGVFIGVVRKKSKVDLSKNNPYLTQIEAFRNRQHFTGNFENALRKSFDIKDYRFKFY